MSVSYKECVTNLNLQQCPICRNQYNDSQFLPYVLCARQHNVCSRCISNHDFDKCPQCKAKIQSSSRLIPNRYYIQIRRQQKQAQQYEGQTTNALITLKNEKNDLSRENLQLKRRLQENIDNYKASLLLPKNPEQINQRIQQQKKIQELRQIQRNNQNTRIISRNSSNARSLPRNNQNNNVNNIRAGPLPSPRLRCQCLNQIRFKFSTCLRCHSSNHRK